MVLMDTPLDQASFAGTGMILMDTQVDQEFCWHRHDSYGHASLDQASFPDADV